jgi:nucleotide-binding universal stress UspA family protein
MFRNILISVDGSAHAERALAEAIDIAEASGARLTLLTAVPQPATWLSGPVAGAAAPAYLGEELEQEYTQILNAAVDRVPPSVPVTKILTRDPIRAALAREFESGRHDLLVMGSRGRGALSASVLGSVSHYVLNHCPVAVLIVHAEEPDPDDPDPAPDQPIV